jgi:MFS family permease
VLPLLHVGFGVSTAELGIVLGTFLAGVGIFQVPAGFAAIRYGSRTVSVSGLLLMGVAGIGSAFAPTILTLAVLRFVVGVGAALFFAPGLSLITQHFPPGERGPIIGLYNGAFSIGGAAGIFGGVLLGAAAGWRFALGLGGVLMLLVAAWVILAVPGTPAGGRPKSLGHLWQKGRNVLASRSIWALAVALTGFWGAVYIVAQYLVQYAYQGDPGWSTGVAGALAAGVVLAAFPGGPIGGWLGERASDRRRLVAIFSILTGLSIFVIPVGPLFLVAPALIALGFFDGLVFAIQYLMPSYFASSADEGVALGIGFLNSVQVLGGSALAIAFGFLIRPIGWTGAWVFAGAAAIAMLPLLMLVERQAPAVVEGAPRPSVGPPRRASPDSSDGLPPGSRP